jgi:hypothetical protein
MIVAAVLTTTVSAAALVYAVRAAVGWWAGNS